MYQKQVDEEPQYQSAPQGYQQPPPGGYQDPPVSFNQPPQQYQQQQQPYAQPGFQPQPGYAPQGGYQQGYGGPPQPSSGFQEYNPHQAPTDDDGKFPERTEYRDPIWIILFFLHLLAVIIILGVANSSKNSSNTNTNNNNSSSNSNSTSADAGAFLPWSTFGPIFAACIFAVIAAVLFAYAYLTVLKRYARHLIHFTLYMGIAWCLILAIIGFARGSVGVGICFLLFAGINILFFWFWRKRIPFATAILTTVARILETYPAPTYYAYASLGFQFAWVLLWMPTFVLVQHYNGTSAGVLSVFLIFSFYWTSQVIKNIVHVTASGLVASWYFLSGVGMPANPTQKAFKRAITTSLGSIILGSLVVAILKTLRQIVNGLRRGNNNFLVCIAACILAILDQLIEYFNLYAFTQVAIYGKTYCQAAKDTWTLVKSRGVDAIVNDNLISGVLILGAILGGVACAVVGGIVALIGAPDSWVALAFVSFLIGMSLVMLTMEVVESGVATIFVCFAMDPAALQRNSPELYNTFVTTYQGLSV